MYENIEYMTIWRMIGASYMDWHHVMVFEVIEWNMQFATQSIYIAYSVQ